MTHRGKRHRVFQLAFCSVLLLATTAYGSCFGLECLVGLCERPDGRLDGSWPLTTIDRRPLSAYKPGYNPQTEGVYITGGWMEFATETWDSDKHEGRVMVGYSAIRQTGAPAPSKYYYGRFEYHRQTGQLILKADGRGHTVKVSADVITASGIPTLGPAQATFVRSP